MTTLVTATYVAKGLVGVLFDIRDYVVDDVVAKMQRSRSPERASRFSPVGTPFNGPHNYGEDQELAGRLHEAGVTVHDPCENQKPFYIYRFDNCSYHLSYMDDAGYRELGQHADDGKAMISIGWPSDYTKLGVIRRFTFAPHVNPRDDRMPVELIGPVDAPGGNGPSNGMYALQKELRKRIDEGLDCPSIKPLPVSEGALPWFRNWADRR